MLDSKNIYITTWLQVKFARYTKQEKSGYFTKFSDPVNEIMKHNKKKKYELSKSYWFDISVILLVIFIRSMYVGSKP
jgi:dolichol kinase